MNRPKRLTGPELLESRDQPAATLLADLNPVGTSAVVALSPGWTRDPAGAATKTAVVFRADDGAHAGLWATDGSPKGAVFLGVNPPYGGSVPNPVAVGDRVFFFSGHAGSELWTTDGRPAGTRRVTTFPSAAFDSFAHDAVAVNGRFVFATDDYAPDGRALLYASDGTAAGTQALTDLAGGQGTRFVTDGKFAYYAVNRRDPSGGTETGTVYQTDGTKAGTRAVATLPAGTGVHVTNFRFPAWAAAAGYRLVFMADNEKTGRELWVIDGTGARMLKDIDPRESKSQPSPYMSPNIPGLPPIPPPTPKGYGSDPQQFVRLRDVVYFVADDGVRGQELWRSDGTPGGTHLVLDLSPARGSRRDAEPRYYYSDQIPSGARIDHLTVVAGKLFFSADDGVHGAQFYTSDGTAGGTVRLTAAAQRPPLRGSGFEFSLAEEPFVVAVVPGKLLFSMGTAVDGRQLWATDGTPAGTKPVTALGRPGGPLFRDALGPTALGVLNGRFLFAVDDGVSGRQLYTTDGTAAGTRLLQRFTTVTLGSNPRDFTPAGPMAFFIADDTARSTAVMATDGKGTPVVVKRYVHTDFGDPEGPTGEREGPAQLTAANGKAFFVTQAGPLGRQLWAIDGTAAGTRLVKEITLPKGYSVTNHQYPLGVDNLTVFRGAVYFTTDVPGTGQQLWRTDGTAAGTALVKLLSPASAVGAWATAESMGPVRQLTLVGDRLFFAANDNVHGEELWASDGTAAGTKMVTDLNSKPSDNPQSANAGSHPQDLVSLNGKVYYLARTDPAGKRDLVVSDGTAAGTRVVARIDEDAPPWGWTPDPPSAPRELVAAGGRLYFIGQNRANGYQLWTSDGTAAGSRRLTAAAQLPVGTSYRGLRAAGTKVYVAAHTPAADQQLWVSDGTPGGTRMAKQFAAGAAAPPGEDPVLAVIGSRVYFASRDADRGRELWVTDGTAAGTRLAADLAPGKADGLPAAAPFAGSSAAVVGDRLILAATDPTRRAEPWAVRLDELG